MTSFLVASERALFLSVDFFNLVYYFNYVTVVNFLVSTHPQNFPIAPLPPHNDRYHHRVLAIVPVAMQPQSPRCFCHTTTDTAITSSPLRPSHRICHRRAIYSIRPPLPTHSTPPNIHPITPNISPPCTVPRTDILTETRKLLRSPPIGV